MVKTKIRVIRMDIDVDFDKELEKRTAISDDFKQVIDEKIEAMGMKKQPIKKNERDKNEWAPKLEKAFALLEATLPHEWGQKDPVAAEKILEESGADGLLPLVMRLKGYLKKEKDNRWILKKHKIGGRTFYSLVEYGS